MTSFTDTDTRLTKLYQAIRENLDPASTTTIDSFFNLYTNSTITSSTISAKIADLLALENNVNNYLQSSSIISEFTNVSEVNVSEVTNNTVQSTSNLNKTYIILSELYANIDRERLDLQALSTKGVTGDKGLKGDNSDKGLPGANGKDGARGPIGPVGDDPGPRGERGEPGLEWCDMGLHSSVFNIVQIPGSSSKCAQSYSINTINTVVSEDQSNLVAANITLATIRDDLTAAQSTAANAAAAQTTAERALESLTTTVFSASQIPSFDASKVMTGVFAASNIPALDAGTITSGTFSAARVANLDASNVATGVFKVTQIPLLGASTINIPILGTLGSFYSCSSLTDTHPTLIATGGNSVGSYILSSKQCLKWAYLTERAVVGASKINVDGNNNFVYFSTSPTGPCYNAVDSLTTQSIGVADSINRFVAIPPLPVSCTNGVCNTVPIVIEVVSYGYNYPVPSLPITCAVSTCSTAPSASIGCFIPQTSGIPSSAACNSTLTIPSLVVGSISSTAGSLYDLCMYSLDN